MDVIHQCCAGLDVHKKTIQACVRRLGKRGKVAKEVRQFGTMTREILALAEWLSAEGVTHVAMESTGVFWKPIWNLLEGRFELMLCNARDIKQVPGRKTDVKDCEWLAQLLQYGLLRASFVPPQPLRELGDLTRHRTQLVKERTAVVNRIHKVLEDANIKLGSVASDVLGLSGRDRIQAIIAGEDDPQRLAALARRRLRGKIPQLRIALEGRVTEHHRFMLKTLYRHLTELEELIDEVGSQIDRVIHSERLNGEFRGAGAIPFAGAAELLKTIPGVDDRSAENILAELGTDMSRCPNAGHLASWAGVCPGNNESAGKRKSGKTPKGNRWLRRTLSQAAWAGSRTKNSYTSAQYRRLCARRGKKRAVVAVAHSILVAVYHILKTGQPYADLGADHFDRLHPDRLKRYLVRRLEAMGHTVSLDAEERVA